MRGISADMPKYAVDIQLALITKIINFFFENCCFPDGGTKSVRFPSKAEGKNHEEIWTRIARHGNTST